MQEHHAYGKHRSKPALVSITQCTEYGTVYNIDELRSIRSICTELGLLLHIDCCRVYNAAAYLDCSLADITSKIGADIISLGGTKIGCMLAESVVIFNPDLYQDAEYIQKNTLQLYSKNRFLACQYVALFENELWRDLAKHQNQIAKTIESKLLGLGFKTTQKVESNHLFVEVKPELANKLENAGLCYIWPGEGSQVRLVTSFDSNEDDIEALISNLK